MIPETTGSSYAPFIKSAEIKKGTVATITSEFQAPTNPKIQSFLIGNIKIGNEEFTLGMNPSTYRTIAGIYGADTIDWVGKEIEFLGMKALGKGKGYLWQAHDTTK